MNYSLGGGFKKKYVHPYLGKISHFDEHIFPMGLVQPPTRWCPSKLVRNYPPGNGYISHQTGSSENHHLQNAIFLGRICYNSLGYVSVPWRFFCNLPHLIASLVVESHFCIFGQLSRWIRTSLPSWMRKVVYFTAYVAILVSTYSRLVSCGRCVVWIDIDMVYMVYLYRYIYLYLYM